MSVRRDDNPRTHRFRWQPDPMVVRYTSCWMNIALFIGSTTLLVPLVPLIAAKTKVVKHIIIKCQKLENGRNIEFEP
jgi:hypothetical protein